VTKKQGFGKGSKKRFLALAVAAVAGAMGGLFGPRSSPASVYYWDTTTTGTWATGANWSNAATGGTTGTVPLATDTAYFDQTTANGAATVQLGAATSIAGLTFANTGTTTLLGGGTAQTLTLGTGSLTLASGAGAVTFGDGTAGNNVLINLTAGSQTWTNNAASNLTINNSAATFTRATGAALTFNQVGTGTFALSTTVLPNSSTGIIGPWAFWGTGTNTKYAFNNAGTIAGYAGTAAATAANLTDTTGVVNYELAAATGTIPATVSANTIRYSGAAGTTTLGTSFTVNGLLNAGSGLWTIGTNTLTIGSNQELVVNTGSNGITISSIVANNAGGASAITSTGAGTLELSGSNTYSGGTFIDSGILRADNSAALGGGAVTVASGASLMIWAPSAMSISNNIALNGATGTAGRPALNQDGGSGLVTLTGTITLNAASDIGLGGTSTNNMTITGPVTGVGGLIVKEGGYNLVLSGSNNYQGGTTFASGTVQANHASALGSTGNLTFTGGTLQFTSASAGQDFGARISGSTSAITIDTNSQSVTFAGAIGASNTGGLTKVGAGTLVLTNANSYAGTTAINAGVVDITNAGALGSGTVSVNGYQLYVDELTGTIANNLTLAGTAISGPNGAGALVFHNDGKTATLSGTVTLAGGTQIRGYSAGGTTIFNNPIGGAGVLIFEAGGAATTHYQNFVLKGGASTYLGATTIAGDNSANAIVQLQGGALPSGTVLSMIDGSSNGTDAVLDLNGYNQTLAGLTNTTSVGRGFFISNTAASGASTLTLNETSSYAFGGVIGVNTTTANTGQTAGAGNIALVKTGVGLLTLSGSNTYTGGTTVNGGNLVFSGLSAIPSSGLIRISSAGALNATGAYTTVAAWLASAKIDTTSTGAIAITAADSETLSFSSYNSLSLGASGAYAYSGTLTPGSNGYLLGGGGGTLTISSALPASGSAGLTVNGNVVLSGANAYTGATKINGGVLLLPASVTLNAASAVTVGGANASGTPTLAGTGTVNGSVTLSGTAAGVAGQLAPGINTAGNFGGVGTLNLAGGATFASGAVLNLDMGANTAASDQIAVTGTLTLPSSGIMVNLADTSATFNTPAIAYNTTYTLATAASGVSGFTANSLSIRNSPLRGATYSFQQSGNNLNLVITGSGSPAYAAGVGSQVYIGGNSSTLPNLDGSVGLNANKTYVNAVNLNGGALTINGVPFSAGNTGANAGTGNPSGTNWTVAGNNSAYGGGGTINFGGQLASLVNVFDYGASAGTITLSSLTPGQTYVFTLYQRAWDAAGSRVATITTSDGGTFSNDVDYGAAGQGFLNLARYTFVATGTTETIKDAAGSNTMHMYGFSTEQVFNNTWQSGANWNSGASWSIITPNYVGANASLPAQSSPGTLTLDGSSTTTVGHLQFDGTNSWTIAGSNALTLQTDPGGVSVVSVLTGTHYITAPLVLNNGTLGVMQTGTGTLVLSGAVTPGSNPWTISNGTLQLNDGALNSTAYAAPIVNNSFLAVNNASSQTLSGALTGVGALTKAGVGALTLAASNNYSGGTSLNAGTLTLGSATAAGTGTVTLNGGTLSLGNLTVANPLNIPAATTSGVLFNSASGGTLSGAVTGSGTVNFSFTSASSGTIIPILPNFSTFAGTIGVSTASSYIFPQMHQATGAPTATLNVSGGSNGTATGSFLYADAGGTINIGALTGNGYIASANAGTTWQVGGLNTSTTFSGVIENNVFGGTAALAKAGTGALTLSGSNTYTGGTTLTSGTLALGSTAALGTGTLTINGGTLDSAVANLTNTNNNAQAWNNDFTFAGTQNLNLGAGTVTLNATRQVTVNAGTLTVAGPITGVGFGLTKAGPGTLTLTAPSTYSGPTTIAAGTLQVGHAVPGALAYYPLNGTLGPVASGATITDASGNGHNGTMGAATTSTYVAGAFGQGINFTAATNDFVSVPYSAAFGVNTFTANAWVNIATAPASGAAYGILGTRNANQTVDIKYFNNGGTLKLHADIGNGATTWLSTTADATTTLSLNTWNMVTYTVNSSGYSIYLNGNTTPIGSGTWSGTPAFMVSGQSLYIGNDYSTPEYMNGSIDDVSIFGSVLTAAQVNALYLAQAGSLPAATQLTMASGATLDLNGLNQTVAALSNSSGGTVSNSALATAGTLTISPASGSATFGGIIGGDTASNPISLVMNGAGTQVLTAANTYLGGTTVSAGTLVAQNPSALGATGAALTLAGGKLDMQTNTSMNALNTTVSATSTLASDVLTPGAGITHTLGTLSINGSTLNITTGANVAGGNPGVAFGATTLTGTATLDVASGTTLTLGNVGGAYNFTKLDSGILVLGGTLNSFGNTTAGLILSAGTVKFATGANYSTANATGALLTINGGTLDMNGNNFQIGNLTGTGGTIVNNGAGTSILTMGGGSAGGGTYQGVIANGTGTIALTKVGGGTITLAGANTYTGTTNINGPLNAGGAEIPGTSGPFGNGGTLTFGNTSGPGLLQYSAANQYDYSSRIASSTSAINIDTNSRNVTFAGILAATNTGGLTLNDSNATKGTLTLAASELYTGATTVTAGTLNITGSVTGTAITVNGGTLAGNATNALTGASSLAVTSGTAILAYANNYTGATTVTGTLQLQNASALASSALTINSASTLQLRADNNTTFAPTGVATGGTGTVTYNVYVNDITSGVTGKTLILANMGQFGPGSTTDTFNVTGGNGYVLQIGTGASGTGALNFYNNTTLNSNTAGVTLSIPGGLSVNYAASYTLGFGGAGNISIGAITRNGTYNVTPTFGGSGIVTLTGANNFGAATATITSTGTLALNNNGALTGITAFTIGTALTLDNTSGSAVLISAAPAETWNNDFTFAGTNALNLGAGAVTLGANRQVTLNGTGTLTVGGIIGGAFNLTTATTSGNGTLLLTGANTFGGSGNTVTVGTGSTLQAGNAQALGNAANAVTVNAGGALDLDATAMTTAYSLTLNGTGINSGGALLNSSGTASYAGAVALASASSIGGAGNLTISSGITGSYGLTKVGGGVLTLPGSNTYTGTTTINGGVLSVTGSLPAGAVAVGGSGATGSPTLAGTGTVNGNVNVYGPGTGAAAGQLAPGSNTAGNFGGVGTLTLAGNATLNSGASLNLDMGSASTNSDQLAVTGALTLPSSGVLVNLAATANPIVYNTPYTIATSGSLANFSPASFTIRNSPLRGATYTFGQSGSNLTLTIAGGNGNAQGLFSTTTFPSGAGQMSDTNVGLNPNKTYQDNANINGVALTINNVPFAAGGTTSGTNWSLTGAGTSYTGNTGANNLVGGQLGALISDFSYNGNPAVLTLSGLTPGQVYVFTNYDAAFGAAGGRIMTSITGSDGGTIANFDENGAGDGNGQLLRYTFVANSATETLTFTPQTANTFHFFGFSNEQVFNNTWQSGTNWSTAAWSTGTTWGGTLTSQGWNASFPAQAAPGTITLNAPETVGHIQFDGTNAWTISGSNTLTLQADAGGVSVLSALTGAHTIAVPISMQNSVMKTGTGTMILSGTVTSNGNSINISNGTLQFGDGVTNNGVTTPFDNSITNNSFLTFANPNAQTYGGVISGVGSMTKIGAGTLTLTGSNTFATPLAINAGTLSVGTINATNTAAQPLGESTALTLGGGTVSGTLLYTGPAVTLNKAVTLGTGGGTIQNGGTGVFTLGGTLTKTGAVLTLNGGASGINVTGLVTSSVGGFNSDLDVTGGTVTLSTAATYDGPTVIYGGGTLVSAVATNALPGTTTVALGSATLESGSAYTNTYVLNGNAQTIVGLTAASAAGFTNTNAVVGGSATLSTLTVTNSATDTYSGVLGGPGANQNNLALVMAGAGTLILTGANTYTGGTTISSGGTLQLGNGNSGTDGSLASANITNTGALVYNLYGNQVYAGSIGGAGTLTKLGPGKLTLSGSHTYTGATAINQGTFNLTGSLGNTATTIASGATLMGNGNNSTTGIIGGAVSNSAGGGFINLIAPGSTLTLNGLTLGSTGSYGPGNYTTLTYTLGNGLLDIGTAGSPTGVLTVNSGGGFIAIAGTPAVGTYTLANFGSSSTGLANFSLSSTTAGVTTLPNAFNTFTLIENSTNLQLQVAGTAIPTAYFKGGVSMVWNDAANAPSSNWSSNLAGTADAGNTPGSLTDVILNASTQTGTVATTLGADTTINSLTVNGNGTNTIAAGNLLTINATTANGHTLGDGITVGSAAHAFMINAPLALGNSQTWTNASGNLFTIGGTVSGTAVTGTQTLTLANTGSGGTTINGLIADGGAGGSLALVVNNSGTGATVLSGANTYSGGTTLSAGTLQLSGSGTLGNTSSSLTVNGGKLDLNGTTPAVGNFTGGSGGTILNSLTSSTATLTIGTGNATGGAFAGVIEDNAGTGGTVGLVKTGSGTLALSGANNYSGGTTINGGTLSVSGFTATIHANGPALLGRTVSSNVITINNGGVLSGTGNNWLDNTNTTPANAHALVVNAGGQLLGSGGITSVGNITLNGGTMAAGNGYVSGAWNGAFLLQQGTLSAIGPASSYITQAVGSTTGNNVQIGTGASNGVGGTVTFNVANIVNPELIISAPIINGTVNKNGAGTVVITSAQGTSGATWNINAGTLQIGAYDTTSSINGAIVDNATLVFNHSDNPTFSNTITGTGGVIQAPTTAVSKSILILSGSNNYSGGTTIASGALQAGHPSAFGTGAVTISSGANLMLWWNSVSPIMANNFILSSMGGVASGDGSNKEAIFADGDTGGYGTYTLSGTINLNATSNIGTYDHNNLLLSGKVTGSGGLVKGLGRANEGGALILSNPANDYAGGTTITSGILRLGVNNAIPYGGSAGNVVVNATLDIAGFSQAINGLSGTTGTVTNSTGAGALSVGNNNATSTFTGTISNTGGSLSLTKVGSGVLTLSGTNTYTGGTTVSAGTLALGGAGNSIGVIRGAVTVNSGGILSAAHDSMGYFAPSANNTGTYVSAVNVNGGTWTEADTTNLTISNDTANAITLTGGTMNAASTGYFDMYGTSGAGNATITTNASATVSTISAKLNLRENFNNLTFYVNRGSGSTDLLVSGPITYTAGSGTHGVIKDGPGIAVFSGSNTYLGGTTIAAGTLAYGVVNALPSAGALTLNGGTLNMATFNGTVGAVTLNSGSITTSGTSVLTGTSYTVQNGTVGAILAGTGSLTMNGPGTLTMTGANTYTGGTTLAGGILNFANGALGSTGNITFAGGMLQSAPGNTQVISAPIMANATSPIAIDTSSSSVYFGAALTGSTTAGLSKAGPGTLTLALPANTYAGGTSVSAGTLQLTNGLAHYSFENNTTDTSGNGLNATFVGGTATYSSNSHVGQAITLNGTSNYLTVPFNASLKLNAFTVSTWVNIATQPGVSSGGGPALVSTRNGGENTFDLQYYQPTAGNYALHADIGTGAGWLTTAANYTLPGALTGWNLVTYAVNSSGYTVYVNGSQATTGSFSGIPLFMSSGETLSFGSQEANGTSWGSGGYLNGALDEISIYGTALTAAQINTLYLGQVLGQQLPATTPVSIASGATLDLRGNSQSVAALSDLSAGSGGTVTSSGASGSVLLTLTPAASFATTFSGVIQNGGGTLGLVLNGDATSTQTLAGMNTYTGGTTITSGTLQLGDGTTNNGSVMGNILNNSALAFANPLAQTYGGSISGSGTLTKSGAGTLSLSGASSYSGGTSVSGGKLIVTSTGSLASGSALNVAGGATANLAYAGATLGAVSNSGTLNFTNTIPPTDTVTLTGGLTGAGTTTFSANAQVVGTVSQGTITVAGNGTFDTLDGATLSITGAATIATVNSGSLTVGGSSTITTVSGGTMTLNGTSTIPTVSGGTMTLNGTGGITTVSGGTLNLYGTSASIGSLSGSDPITLGTTALTITNGYYGGSIQGANGSLSIASSGSVVLSGSNSYGGGTTLGSGGTLQIGNGGATGALATSSAITDNGTLIFNRNNTVAQGVDFSGSAITGTGSLFQAGSGTLMLTGANSYAGGTTIGSGGTLQLGGGSLTGSLPTTSVITDNGTLLFNRSNTVMQGTDFGNTITGTGGLMQSGSGNLILAPTNGYSGITTLNSGTLSVSNLAGNADTNDSLGVFSSNNGNLVLNGGTLNYTGAAGTTNRSFTLGGGPVTITSTGALTFAPADATNDAIGKPSTATTLTLAGEGTGTAANTLGIKLWDYGTAEAVSLVKAGGGTWILAAGIDNTTVHAPGLWSGNTTISAGTLQLGATEALPSLSTLKENKGTGTNGNVLIASGATLDLHGFGNTINGLGDAGTVDAGNPSKITNLQANSTALLAVGDNNQTTTFSGVIQNGATGNTGVIALAKFGTGTLTLNGSNTYSGDTTIQNGTVVLGTAGALPSGTALVMSPTTNTGVNIPTLDLGGQHLSVSTLAGTTAASAAVPLGYDHIVVEGWNYTKTSGGFAGNTVTGGNVIELLDGNGNAVMPSGLLVGQAFTSTDFPSGTTIAAISGLYVQLNKSFTGTIANNQPVNSSGTFGGIIPGTSSNTPVISNNGTTTALLTVGTGVSGNSSTYAGVIRDGTAAVALELTGSNRLTLTGSNTFTGGTTIGTGSTLLIGDGTASGSRIGGSILNNGTLTVNTPASDPWTYSGNISGGGTLSLTGSSNLTLAGGTLNNNDSGHVALKVASSADFAGAPVITRSIVQGAVYGTVDAPLGSTAAGAGSTFATTGKATTADIVYGTNNQSLTVPVHMQWAARTTADTSIVFSDVLSLTGMATRSNGYTDTFVLEMSYDWSLAGVGDGSQLFLGYYDPTKHGWENAVMGNDGGGLVGTHFTGAWTADAAHETLGAWGVDTANHMVWAVIDHNSDFAVIPEPTSLGLLGLGALGLLARRGKRKA